jgi:hypothetical protein
MMEPIRLAFEVACPVEHAFATWTDRTSTWWPASHTVTAADGLQIRFEPRVAAGSGWVRPAPSIVTATAAAGPACCRTSSTRRTRR